MDLEPFPRPIVVKVGGSLFDLPDLGPRLAAWLATQAMPLLVPGGGPTTDVVRLLDRTHRLGEGRSHWLALYALALNGHFLAALLGTAAVVRSLDEAAAQWHAQRIPILDAFAFAEADEGQPGSLPHSWDVTSDSIAARAARVFGARKLVLLKSTELPAGASWPEAGHVGFVDAAFASQVSAELEIEVVCFRTTGA